MNYCGIKKSCNLGMGSSGFILGETNYVTINVLIQPIMHNDVPFTVVTPKFIRIPPIHIENSVLKTKEFSKQVEPTMQKSKEHHDKPND